jgi:hypothetical protein
MPLYSHPYNNKDYEPPMSVMEVALLSRDTGEVATQVLAIVDSGADATLLPIESLRTARARYYRSSQLRGVTGQAVPVELYAVTLQLGPYVIHGIKAVAGVRSNEAILGRDVLNQLDLRLIGPAQELWLE